jgi:hypothetical protein
MNQQDHFVTDFLEILVSHNVISAHESRAIANNFASSDHDSFIIFLRQEGLVDPDKLLEALSTYYQVPAFDVVGQFFDHELVRQFPKGFLLRNGIIPLECDENILIMVTHDPNDQDILAKIGEHVSYDIQFRVGFKDDICDAIKEFYDISLTEVNEDEDYVFNDEIELLDDNDID